MPEKSISPELNAFLDGGGKLAVLDGLRGWAILLVILYHSTASGFASPAALSSFFHNLCWSGVDMFFVLSGFLITNLLLRNKAEPHYFKNFYIRRILRIFPLYYAYLAVVVIMTGDTQGFLYHALFLSNFLLVQGLAASQYPGGLTWSLSIEEQFYLCWPSLVFFLRRGQLIGFVVVIILTATVLKFLNFFNHEAPFISYISTQTRMDTLAYGALIALVLHADRRHLFVLQKIAGVMILLAPLCIGLIWWQAGTFFFIGSPLTGPLGFPLVALTYASILILSLNSTSKFSNWMLRNKFILLAGKHSYCMYLIHVEVIYGWLMLQAVFPSLNGSYVLNPLIVLTTLGISVVIWHAFEKHFIAMKKFFPYDAPKQPALALKPKPA